MALIGALVATSLFVQRVFRLDAGVLREHFQRQQTPLLKSTRVLWYPLGIAAPLALALTALAGYGYAAQRVFGRLELSLFWILVMALGHRILLRWLFLVRRRLAMEQAKSAAKPTTDEVLGAEGAALVVDEQKLDIASLDAGTRQLFRAAITVGVLLTLFGVWAELLPAVRILDRVELYPNFHVRERGTRVAGGERAEAPTPSAGNASGRCDSDGLPGNHGPAGKLRAGLHRSARRRGWFPPGGSRRSGRRGPRRDRIAPRESVRARSSAPGTRRTHQPRTRASPCPWSSSSPGCSSSPRPPSWPVTSPACSSCSCSRGCPWMPAVGTRWHRSPATGSPSWGPRPAWDPSGSRGPRSSGWPRP